MDLICPVPSPFAMYLQSAHPYPHHCSVTSTKPNTNHKTMAAIAHILILVFSAAAIGFIIATSATNDSVTKACSVTLNRPIVFHPLVPALTKFPMPETGLFKAKLTVTVLGVTETLNIKTKELDEVSDDFQAAQAFAILSAITFFAASCVHVVLQLAGAVPQSVGRFAGFVHLVATVFAVICGSILLGAVHKNVIADDQAVLHSSDDDHSLSECSLNYGIPFIFAAAGLGIVNCILFCFTGWTGAAPAPADDTADVEAEAAPANVEAKEVHTTEPAQV